MVRFDKPCRRVAGAVDYFREHLGVGDYLTEGNKARMTWFGRGAARLGLEGVCDLVHFENLGRGLHPVTGEKLSARDKGAQRRVCFFGQISAPKDVSLASLVGGDQRITGWWEEAVQTALTEIEAVTATRVRRRGACEDRTTGNMVAAVVTHDASRALDPQLHTHICVMNLTYDETEQRWKGVQPAGFYRHQAFFREVCFQKLAARMVAAGYELTDIRPSGFNLKGIPAELRETFSKRRRDILAKAAKLGVTSQDALQGIATNTRAAKRQVASAELRTQWRQEAGAGLGAIQQVIAGADGRRKSPAGLDAAAALASAEAHLFERRSVVGEQDLLREALRAGAGEADLPSLRATVSTRLEQGALLRLGDGIASREALLAEQEFVAWAHANRSARPALGIPGNLAGLGADQRSAVAAVLNARGRVVILQGDAGTGKTTCLRAILAGIQQAGGRVFGCAPSSGAADVLRKELTPAADTLQHWLLNETLQQETRGRVLLVDEAGLISGPQMLSLCRLAAKHGNRIILVGDSKQHHAVEAGDALRCLQKFARVPVARLEQIRRQRNPAYREAVAALARGDAHDAFRRFEQLGAVKEIARERELFRAAAADYVQTIAARKRCLAISPVWSEIRQFTEVVRAQLRSAGVLAGEERTFGVVSPLHWTKEERRRVQHYRPGDVLVFHRAAPGFAKHELVTILRRQDRWLEVRREDGAARWLDPRRSTGFEVGERHELPVAVGDRLLIRGNAKPLGLKNGDIVEVAGFVDHGTILLRDGRRIPAYFRQFAHGYATTSHAAQGKTVDRGILLMGDEATVAADLKQAYVSNSRFRDSQMIYTTDRVAALAAMQRPGDRRLAIEAATESAGPAALASVAEHAVAPGLPGQAAGMGAGR
ncbi:MAG: MobF family relaxase [Opitutaceae bacterium]|nr:MobF family relaxase [Opitutaceae bacterium]